MLPAETPALSQSFQTIPYIETFERGKYYLLQITKSYYRLCDSATLDGLVFRGGQLLALTAALGVHYAARWMVCTAPKAHCINAKGSST